MTPFEDFLKQHDEESWSAVLTTLLRSIHEVDRNATQIWFAFYPLGLHNAIKNSSDPQKLMQQLLMQGSYELKDQVDSSHKFLFGHRYWPQVKAAVQAHATAFTGSETSTLAEQIVAVATKVASKLKIDPSLTVGV